MMTGTNFASFFSGTVYRRDMPYYTEHEDELERIKERFVGLTEGMTFTELAELFSDLGCTAAFSLDGGNSSMMTMNGALVSSFSGSYQRKLSDILFLTDRFQEVHEP